MQLQEQLRSVKKDFRQFPINSLCVWNQNEPSIPCLRTATPLVPMLIPFAVMTTFKNDFYYRKWQDVSQNLKNHASIDEIFSDIWMPVFDFCTALVQKLRKRDILIREAEALFANENEADNIKNITQLVTAVQKCQSNEAHDWKYLAMKYCEVSVNELVCAIPCESHNSTWIGDTTKIISEWCSVRKLFPFADVMLQIFSDFKAETFIPLHMFSTQVHYFDEVILVVITIIIIIN